MMGKSVDVSTTLERLLSESPGAALALVFWIGAVTSLSACTVMHLPIVLGYVGASDGSRRRMLCLTALFLVGVVISHTLIGAVAAFAGGVIQPLLGASQFIFWGFGALLFIVGSLICGLISPRFFPRNWRPGAARLEQLRSAGALILGLLFGLLMMPACPLCGAGLIVLAGIVTAKNLGLYGLAMFISFALGQGLPIVAVGTLTAIGRPNLIRKLRAQTCSIEQRIQLICGNLLMVLGIYFIVVG
jgi:cytochrome c-type biogenesis protein